METKNITNADRQIVEDFEKKVRDNLFGFLQKSEQIDKHIPECIDVENCWPDIARDYLLDGAREFQKYPVVSLGWMMLIGMAMAYFWDEDWEKYSAEKKIYHLLREKRGYDNMDDAILEDVLKYEGESVAKESAVVQDCAARVYSLLSHEHVEPGTEAALGCYIAALHQLYLAGVAMELKTLGYHMTKL